MSKKIVHFKANAGVKDIVGKGLIHDDNIAIIELVKNSKDANSSKALIHFEDESSMSETSSLTISDYGDGMTYDDIVNKWLNIAYSEKKGQKFDAETAYAGSKGVGRFSCDRLGKELVLYTKSSKGDYLKLPINWELFEEKGQNDEISNIDLECHIMDKNNFFEEINSKKFEHGTILKIKKLRSDWGSRKLKKLISELEKFSPSLDSKFDVFIYSNTKYRNDGADKGLNEKLNKKINNNILEKLSFKTTCIKSHIDPSGKTLITSLYYEDDELYTYIATNPYEHLKNISIEIHYLDTLSKSYFTKNIGIKVLDYGSIFLFYNGFRVSPYGNARNDWLSLDQRKSQGTARCLGTREVFGRIDIKDNDDSFSVVTSREGLAHNKAFYDLAAFDKDQKTILENGKESYGYAITIIRQLEQFVVSGLNWNRLIDRISPGGEKVITEFDILKNPDRYQLKDISSDKVQEACDKILKSDFEITEFKINDSLILNITETAEKKYKQFVDDFVEKTKSKSIKNLSSNEKGVVKKIVKEEQEKTRIAKEERDYAEEERSKAEDRVVTEKRRSHFLEKLASPEKTLDALITHVMKQISGGIEKDVKFILGSYYKNPEKISKADLVEVLEDVAIDIATIKESAIMATKADFNLKISSIKEDIFAFLEDYILEVASKEQKWGLNINFKNPDKLKEIKIFKHADLGILFTNILDNSRKAHAKNLTITCKKHQLLFSDDGDGFDLKTYESSDFFRKGITTTDGGSGLGLFHCKSIVEHWGGKISISNNKKSGALIIVSLNNEKGVLNNENRIQNTLD